ncbi:MAG: Holliday junction branch migration DNA helicase RuvB, partial [Spirochaetales bacterium]|nr:Holliday junction branch migration DNA helicase RuvB [Spirochaetales bacterium]
EYDKSLRPKLLREFIGQTSFTDNLKVYIEAAKKRNEPLDHLLLSGPPGLGKTTLASIVANEMNTNLKSTSAPILEKTGDLAAILTDLERGDILFIDEIHRLKRHIEEVLYSAMEDFTLDIIIGQGPAAKSVKINLEPFTLIGATTRSGLISSPLLGRFGIKENLDYYTTDDMMNILTRSAGLLETTLDDDAAKVIAKCSRGTPRVANGLLKRVRDFAQITGGGRITKKVAEESLTRLQIDELGLNKTDIRLLNTIIDNYDGGPVGAKTLAISIGEEADTIEEVYEPYLIQLGFLKRTPRGRMATRKAYEHLGRKYGGNAELALFDVEE